MVTIAAGLRPGYEILVDGRRMSRKGKRMLDALRNWAPDGSHIVVTSAYSGRHQNLMLYGVGENTRALAARIHRRRGGNVIMWDMGYFERDQGGMRLAINSPHPSAIQIYSAPNSGRDPGFPLREDADPDGPILLVGLGKKSLPMLGLGQHEWEINAYRELQAEFPGRQIRWRPKGLPSKMEGTELWFDCDIATALRGCSMVRCRHSNVGIDAIIAGVPVRCDDGAAKALMQTHPDPTPAQRADFIQRLGWFNWKANEAQQAWTWIEQLIWSS